MANKPVIYRFGDYTDMSRLYGNASAGVGGFFIPRAGASVGLAARRLDKLQELAHQDRLPSGHALLESGSMDEGDATISVGSHESVEILSGHSGADLLRELQEIRSLLTI